MRPISLELKGFTSFRETARVDFSSLDLFAITGPTGAGKTSILDAIIFALYGRTPRIGEKNIGDLISQGAERLQVLLEFSAAQKNYRLARTVKKTAKSVSSSRRLEVQREAEDWEPIADGANEVRDKVKEIVGLEFDGFIKSVVLPQGEFDTFLNGKPPERRQILQDLLKLDVYLKMARRAREIAEQAQSEADMREKILRTTFAEATEENKEALKKELAKVQTEQKTLVAKLGILKDAEPIAHNLRRERSDLEKSEKDRKVTQQKLEQTQASAKHSETASANCQKQVRELAVQIEKVGYDEKLYLELTRFVPVGKQLEELREAVKERHKEKESKVADLARLQPQLKLAETRRSAAIQAKKEAEEHFLEKEKGYQTARVTYGSAEFLKEALTQMQERPQREAEKVELEQRVSQLLEESNSLTNELQNLNQRATIEELELAQAIQEFEQLRSLHAAGDLRRRLKVGEPCPVCEQVVAVLPGPGKHKALDSAKRLVEEKQRKRDALNRRIVGTQKTLEGLPKQIDPLKSHIKELKRSIAKIDSGVEKIFGKLPHSNATGELKRLEKKIIQLEAEYVAARAQRERAREAALEVERVATNLRHEEALLKQAIGALEKTIGEQSRKVENLEKELGKWSHLSRLSQEMKAQKEAKDKKEELERRRKGWEDQLREKQQELIRFRTEVSTLTERIAGIEGAIRKVMESIEELETQFLKRTRDLLKAKGADEAERLEKQWLELDKTARELGTEVARTEAKLQQVTKQIKDAAKIRVEVEDLRNQAALAHELGVALKADQFISFILEEAFNRLAHDGTSHLRTLSSGRYSFSVNGDDFYVVDHWNADEKRPVNTLSGGECFLASLSLALALAGSLSEFCTEREKFSLDSLFLDEGFSTLDVETLDTVIQGIENLATGDRLIGVISHIPEFAERFPSRIEVRKSPVGSSLLVD